MSLYAKLVAGQVQQSYREWRSNRSADGRRKSHRDERLPKCARCKSEWTQAQLDVGCPTCAGIERVRRLPPPRFS